MLTASRLFSHTSSFHPPLFLNRCNLFLQISSMFPPLNNKGKIVNTSSTNSSPLIRNQGLPDGPLSDSSHDIECCYMMIGSIPVPLLCNIKKNCSLTSSTSCAKNCSLSLTTSCAPSMDHPESKSSSNHLSSPQTTPGFEHKKPKRKTCVDLGSPLVNMYKCSGHSNGSNLSLSQKSTTRKFTNHYDESPEGSSWKKKSGSVDRAYDSHSNSIYAASGQKFYSPKPFDICFRGRRNPALVGSRVLGKNEESYFGMQNEEAYGIILRPGMVLLKHYLNHSEQVEIVKNCREFGMGPGGFYQPGYGDGAKLRLQMMCLGLDWDPQTRKYGKKRAIDGSEPPCIPQHFSEYVMRAMQDASHLIKEEYGVRNVEDILPSLTPDICIVNFYNTTGRLGLHQDRDESRESLRKGLPVVSFSIGDSADFLYGDQRDIEKAESVILESGDVLIFGGESRHVFHGVSSILSKSAPEELLKDTGLRPGRLNLTFRQY